MNPKENRDYKVVVITGATSGIGYAAAQALAGRGFRIIGVGRDEDRCIKAQAAILETHTQSWVRYFLADLASQRQVRKLAEDIRETVNSECEGMLDVLINNAAAVANWYTATEDGYELQFAVNHLAPFLLTHELFPLLKVAPAARIITTSSNSHRRGHIYWDNVMQRKGYNTLRTYQQSKLANVLFTFELNRRLGEDSNVHAYAVDPGLVNTQIGMKGTSGLVYMIWNWRRRGGATPEEGATTLIHLAADLSVDGSRDILWKNCLPIAPNPKATIPGDANRLWQLSERLCGISFLG